MSWVTGICQSESTPPKDTPGGKLLYQGEDGWSMYDWNGKDKSAKDHQYSGDESFLVHACPNQNAVSEVYIFPDTHKACWRCQAPLPDGMRALWILHNERI